MRDRIYAILGDIHGNWEALSAVLEDSVGFGADHFICVGDVVGYNADPSDCLDKIRELESSVVRGNHDHYCSHNESLDDFHPLAAEVIDWTRQHLTSEQIEYLRNLKMSEMLYGFTIVHSTLDMPEKWGYVVDSIDADANFNYQVTSLCFHGHTHRPVVFEKHGHVTRNTFGKIKITLGRKYFVNVGSVGQPRDGDPRAAYVLYDMKNREMVLRRVEYDIEKTQAKIYKAGLPRRLARRLARGE